jgi:hypothetical protein
MSAEKEPVFMICTRTTHKCYVPSTILECAMCKHDIWVSTASLDTARAQDATMLCEVCGLNKIANDNDVKFRMPTPEQWKEILSSGPAGWEGH